MQERQRNASAGNDDALTSEAGSHQREIARRFAIEVVEEGNGDSDHDDRSHNSDQHAQDDHTFPLGRPSGLSLRRFRAKQNYLKSQAIPPPRASSSLVGGGSLLAMSVSLAAGGVGASA